MHALLKTLMGGGDLREDEAAGLMGAMAAGAVDPVLAGALLVALRIKGESAAEVRGFARRMRALARTPQLPTRDRPVVDIVGTGGDGSGSLNLSTTAALLAAAAGCAVVKHGNRAVSSRSGSADVLEALGLALGAGEGAVLQRTGFTFLFARAYHPAMKNIAPIRAALGVRTVFNLLGPLTNPAAPPYLVIGAYSPAAARLMAQALSALPIVRAFVIHGAPGWDEPTPVGPFLRCAVTPGQVEEQQVDPLERYGLPRCAPKDLLGGDADYNAAAITATFDGAPGPRRHAALLGAAQALEVTGLADGPRQAIDQAAAAIDSGAAAAVLAGLSR